MCIFNDTCYFSPIPLVKIHRQRSNYAGAKVAMDRADAEIEEEDVMGNSSWSAAFLRRSWWIGKRVAFAGAAIASSPVIIPPLFILSTLGLAFSFPFGIYLTGRVCADKIMSVLLPLPPLREEVDKEFLESEDLMERGFDTGQGYEMVLDEEKLEKVEMLEGKGEEGSLLEFRNRNGVERPAVEMGVEGEVEEVKAGEKIVEEDEKVNSVEGLRKSDFSNSAEEVRGVQLGEEVREDVTASLANSGSPKSPYTVVVMDANEESNKKEYEPPNLSSEHLSIVELRGEGMVNDISMKKELKEEGGIEEKRLRAVKGVVAKGNELLDECTTEVPKLKSDYILSAVIISSKDEDAENLEKVDSMEHTCPEKPVPVSVVSVGVTGLHSHDDISSLQRTHDEEKLWDQIFSMRAIVGYKETLQPSLGEELMALYLLIGVEPPISLKGATDLAEISNSLQFLKSVVGVE